MSQPSINPAPAPPAEPAKEPAKVSRWQSLKSLQTFAFMLGWVVGVPAGALIAIAWGLSTTQTTYASMRAAYTEVVAALKAVDTRQDALEKADSAANVDRASIRDRVAKLESAISPYIVTSDVIEKFGSHLGALDGRNDEIKRNLDAERQERVTQFANLCAKLVGLVGASGKKSIQCP